ncbi:Clp protease N-terminal domain-containing protein [Streptomyces sp. NPDC003401]
MEATVPPDWNVVGVLGAARGAQGDPGGAVGTEHLLAGLAGTRGSVGRALAAEGATRAASLAVLRDRTGRSGVWDADDDVRASVAARDVLGDDGPARTRFTGAAAEALAAAMRYARREDASRFGAEHLLLGLLESDDRATELLGVCGTSPQAVLVRLVAGAADREDGAASRPHDGHGGLACHGHHRRKPLWRRCLGVLGDFV